MLRSALLPLLLATGATAQCLDAFMDCCGAWWLEPASCTSGLIPSRQPPSYADCYYSCDAYPDLAHSSSACQDAGGDCCANQLLGEWAVCAEGYYPSHQPQTWLGCPNYRCFERDYIHNLNEDTSNTCTLGDPILSADGCQAAADALGYPYLGESNINYGPGGCFLYYGAEAPMFHGMYYNTHSGSTTGTAWHIKVCKVNDNAIGVIIGIAVGAVVAVIGIIVAIVCVCKKTRHTGGRAAKSPPAALPQQMMATSAQAVVPMQQEMVVMGSPMMVVQQQMPAQVVAPAAGPKFDPQTGQPIVQPSGPKFDPQTGQPLPKFDPLTGKQNW